jgi:ComF family protein
VCRECINDEPAFITADSFGLYDGALKKAINLLKYHGIKRLSKPLSDLLSRIKLPDVDAVIPVPLHPKRLRQREYNQSALIAYKVAKKLDTTLFTDCLIKTKDTPPQVGLSSNKRRTNMKSAFEVKNQNNIKGGNILLIDDVVTTGATIRECSATLKEANVKSIHVIALAHRFID